MLLVQLVVVGVLYCFEGAAVIGELQESVAFRLTVFGQWVMLVDDFTVLELKNEIFMR